MAYTSNNMQQKDQITDHHRERLIKYIYIYASTNYGYIYSNLSPYIQCIIGNSLITTKKLTNRIDFVFLTEITTLPSLYTDYKNVVLIIFPKGGIEINNTIIK